MRPLIIASLLALAAACTPSTPSSTTTAPVSSPTVSTPGVPAPTPGDVRTRITAAQNGQAVEVAVNQRFAVELVGVPTAGYVWAPRQMPAFVSRAGEASGNTVAAQSQPGYTGGNHWEVLMFVAMAPGSGELVIEQRRPWEANEPANQSFRVTIVAR